MSIPVVADPQVLPEQFLTIEAPEVWVSQKPQRGDHIRVSRLNGLYYHHGIYVTDDEVIHFTGDDDDSVLDWSKAHVIRTDLAKFLDGGTAEVKVYNEDELADLYPVEGIVNYARACLGDDGYHLIFNNCEHFANVCTLGRFRSRQVEDVLGGNNMSIFGSIWDSVKSIFSSSSSGGSRSTSNYNYEPDKVRVAEIERNLKLEMADKERERIELMRDAQLELLKAQGMTQMAIDEARTKNMKAFAEQLAALQEKMLEVAKNRIVIIEEGSLPMIREIEAFYEEVGNRIQAKGDEYTTKKLPQLLHLLQQYEKDSPEYEIFASQIKDDRERQNQFIMTQLQKIQERQELVTKNFLETKDKIIEQTGRITQTIAEEYLKKKAASLLPDYQSTAMPELAHKKAGAKTLLKGQKKELLSEGQKRKNP
ncbi:lecithin retinol acyltransferase family protein [uncultured Mitsuokella sp.]|uniref:lecithin retinol acyltransferase family protein n=1 Tax=uncultured Mitsuokella sp. TaxID=453120 RepID=UPI002670125C|nr:lecithin retinol acyltransferase family protein [uncultured Mitsuokella sp.]